MSMFRPVVIGVLVLVLVSLGAAAPVWIDRPTPNAVHSFASTDCSGAAACLAQDDDQYTTSCDGGDCSEMLTMGVQDPVPANAVLHEISVHAKLRTDMGSYGVLQVWTGSGYQSVGAMNEQSEEWINETVTGMIQPDNAEYLVRVQTSQSGINLGTVYTEVDVLLLRFTYTKTGTLGYKTGATGSAPALNASTIAPGEQSRVTATVVCTDGYCGEVRTTLRANETTIDNIAGLDRVTGDNPQRNLLCNGEPDIGSCDTPAVDTAWTLEGVQDGQYVLDLHSWTKNDRVNEPVSDDALLTVESTSSDTGSTGSGGGGTESGGTPTGTVIPQITPSTDTVVEQESFTVSASVTCNASGGCTETMLQLETGTGIRIDTSTTPFATTESNPRSCGSLTDGDVCTRTWDVTASGSGTNTYELQARAWATNITDAMATSGVTIEQPRIAVTGVSIDGNTRTVTPTVSYESNVAGELSCTVNGGAAQTVDVPARTEGMETLSFTAPVLGASNDVSCTLENVTHSVSDTASTSFTVGGSMMGAGASPSTVEAGGTVTASCPVENMGGIAHAAGGTSPGHAQLELAITGPGAPPQSESFTADKLGLPPGGSTTIYKTFTVPSSAEGAWQVECRSYALIDTYTMDDTMMTSGFTVEQPSETGIDLALESPVEEDGVVVGDTITVQARVENRSTGDPILGAAVTVNGNPLMDDGTGADVSADDGVYAGELRVPQTDAVQVTVTAQHNAYTQERSVVLTVLPGFRINPVRLDDQYRVSDTVVVNGSVDANRPLVDPSATVRFVNPVGSVDATRVAEVAQERFTVLYALPAGAETGEWTAQVSVRDAYETRNETKRFVVEVPRPGAFSLEFREPRRTEFSPGEQVPVRVRPADANTDRLITIESVRCRLGNVTKTLLSRSDGTYGGEIAVPQRMEPGRHRVTCNASRIFEGERKTAKNHVTMTVRPIQLSVEVLEPRGNVLRSGVNTTIRANVSRDGRPVRDASVRLVVNGNATGVVLRATNRSGIYETRYVAEDTVESVAVAAADETSGHGESATVTVTRTTGFDAATVFALISGILGVLFVSYGVYRRYVWEPVDAATRKREHLQEQLDDARRQVSSIQQAMKDAEKKYYRRAIDKQTYLENMRKYEKEKTQLVNELEALEAELAQLEEDHNG